MTTFTESIIEQATINWLKDLSYVYAFGPEIPFDSFIRTPASLREALLPKLMRGNVKVDTRDAGKEL